VNLYLVFFFFVEIFEENQFVIYLFTKLHLPFLIELRNILS